DQREAGPARTTMSTHGFAFSFEKTHKSALESTAPSRRLVQVDVPDLLARPDVERQRLGRPQRAVLLLNFLQQLHLLWIVGHSVGRSLVSLIARVWPRVPFHRYPKLTSRDECLYLVRTGAVRTDHTEPDAAACLVIEVHESTRQRPALVGDPAANRS